MINTAKKEIFIGITEAIERESPKVFQPITLLLLKVFKVRFA